MSAAQRKGLYDEPYKRMDEWLDGRRDVDLDGARRGGGGPAGRRNWQAVQKMTQLTFGAVLMSARTVIVAINERRLKLR
jgi:hypothetical protein